MSQQAHMHPQLAAVVMAVAATVDRLPNNGSSQCHLRVGGGYGAPAPPAYGGGGYGGRGYGDLLLNSGNPAPITTSAWSAAVRTSACPTACPTASPPQQQWSQAPQHAGTGGYWLIIQ